MKKTLLMAAFGLSTTLSLAQEATFTSSGTWIVPTGVSIVEVTVVGAGGNGGINGSGGGGGGGYASGSFTVSPGATYNITVGTGGSTVATSVSGLSIMATPGVSAVYSSSAIGGLGGVGSGGSVNFTGGKGGNGTYTYFGGGGGGAAGPSGNGSVGESTPPWAGVCLYPGGAGGVSGGSPAGDGGKGAGFTDVSCSATNPATTGLNYGGGGGGGNGNGGLPSNGAGGYVRISWCGTVDAPTGAITQSFCSSDSATVADLSASGTGIQWYAAATGGVALDTNTYLSNGTYYASQTLSGCESNTRLAVAVEVTTVAAPVVTGIQNFCAKDSALVTDLIPSGTGYNWYGTATSGTALPESLVLVSGSYFASQVESGCESADRSEVSVMITSPEVGTSFSGTTITADADSATYQWINCMDNQPIAGATEKSYTTVANGSYAVIVTQNGCTDTSDCVVISTTGISRSIASGDFSLFPNPASRQITVKVAPALDGAAYIITDAIGRKVITGKLKAPTTEIQIQQLSNGIYHFQAGDLPGQKFKVIQK